MGMQIEVLGVGTFQSGGGNFTGEGSGMRPGDGKIKYRAEDYVKSQEEKNRKPKVWCISDKKIYEANIGSAVEVLLPEGEKEIFIIVEPFDANTDLNQISYESPLGYALFRESVGTTVEVDAPAGVFKYEILNIWKCE